MTADRLYREEDWPHGLRCAECHRIMGEGDRICEQPVAFQDDIPVVRVVCQPCDEAEVVA